MKRLLTVLILHFSLLASFAQGIPFLRNYLAEEYHANDINFDVKTGKGGNVYIANFEGLLLYDNEAWHVIHTPGNRRVTVTYLDKDSVVWAGGYNFFGRISADHHGEPYLHRAGHSDSFQGEVLRYGRKTTNCISSPTTVRFTA